MSTRYCLAVALVILVIFIFLRNLSATLIPSLALPMSLIGTFAAMALLGYSLDNLSLMALTLCVGFVVDGAIVMLENIVATWKTASTMEAAFQGAKEIGFTIISMTLSLSAVFIPILFMSGLLGRLLHEFAVTIVVAVLVSGFVSLTLTPMMCSRFVHSEHGQKHGQDLLFFRALLRLAARSLRPDVAGGHAPSWCDAACIAGDFRGDGGLVRRDSQRVFPRRRHRQDRGHHRGRAGHFI